MPAVQDQVSASAVKPHERLAYIDTLRALACLWVFVHHAWIWCTDMASVGGAFGTRLVVAGDLGVDLFLVLSGFCLAAPILHKQSERSARIDFRSWIARRAWRILPPYYCALLLFSAALLIPKLAALMPVPTHWYELPLHILMLHNLNVASAVSVVNSFWSLALEFQLYLLFPVALWLLRTVGLRGLLISTAALSFIWSGYCASRVGLMPGNFATIVASYSLVPGRAVEFACGIAAAVCVARSGLGQSRPAMVLALLLIPVSIWLSDARTVPRIANWTISPPGIKSVIAGIGFAALLVALRPLDARVQGSRLLRPLTQFGAISYSAYLLQEPLIRYAGAGLSHLNHGRIAPAHWGLPLMLTCLLPVWAGLTLAFYRVAERPFLRGKPARLRRSQG